MTRIERRGRRDRRAGLFSANSAISAFLSFVVVHGAQMQTRTETGTFAGGCFWSMEHVFDELWRTSR